VLFLIPLDLKRTGISDLNFFLGLLDFLVVLLAVVAVNALAHLGIALDLSLEAHAVQFEALRHLAVAPLEDGLVRALPHLTLLQLERRLEANLVGQGQRRRVQVFAA
jgi:hypothetical protein